MRTRSIGYALSWEYWRRGMYWLVPGCVLLVLGLMAPFYAVLSIKANVHAELNHAVVGVVGWAPLVMALAGRGYLRRQFTLPARTATLVAWALANGALAVALTYWLLAVGFNLLFQADWPYGGPAWWAVVVYVAFQTAVWSLASGRGVLLLPLAILAHMAIFAEPFHLYQRVVPRTSDTGAVVWPTVSAAELAVSLLVVAAFSRAAVYVVARDRRGEAWQLTWLSPARWWQAARDLLWPGAAEDVDFTARQFRSPRSAQFWLEWRSKGRYLPLSVAGVAVVVWIAALVEPLSPVNLAATLSVLSAMFLFIAPFVGVYLGYLADRGDMRPFLATRPLSDGQLASIVLRSVAAAGVAAAALWIVAVGLMSAAWRLPPGIGPLWREAPWLLLTAWTLLGLGASLAMARSWFVPTGGLSIGVLLLMLVYGMEKMPPAAAEVTRYLLAAGCLVGTLAAFTIAWRRKLVAWRTVLGALGAYALLSTYFLSTEGGRPVELALSILGLCAAPLAPLALAPLALAWNRRR